MSPDPPPGTVRVGASPLPQVRAGRLVKHGYVRMARQQRQLLAALAPHPHPELVHLVATPADDVAVEAHEEADLLGGALPVLRREGVKAEPLDPEFDCATDDVDNHRLAHLVALSAGQSALSGPAAIAVHHDGDMDRQAVGGNPRRNRFRRVLGWPAGAAARRWR